MQTDVSHAVMLGKTGLYRRSGGILAQNNGLQVRETKR